ncbi:hypothetical protein QP256_04685 [Aerococcus sp. UMB8487]|nr:hypothetical protein [Aerococcus sp. UMB8487]
MIIRQEFLQERKVLLIILSKLPNDSHSENLFNRLKEAVSPSLTKQKCIAKVCLHGLSPTDRGGLENK